MQTPHTSALAAHVVGWAEDHYDTNFRSDVTETIMQGDGYLLIEAPAGGNGEWWISSHRTPRDAARYAVEQECAEDWEPVALVSLGSLIVYPAERVVRFTAGSALDLDDLPQ